MTDRESVIICFSQIAFRYDFLNRFLSMGRDSAWRNIIADRARNKAALSIGAEKPKIADVCTGTGDMALLFGGEQWSGTVIGVDLSDAMLAAARKKRDRQNLGTRVRFKTADALSLPFPEGQFDIVTICFGLRNLTDRDLGVRELLRILKPGGSLYILEFAPKQPGFAGLLYRFYLTGFVPLLGTLFSGVSAAYRYLADSIRAFLEPQEVRQMLSRHGAAAIRTVPLTYGVVYLYSCRK